MVGVGCGSSSLDMLLLIKEKKNMTCTVLYSILIGNFCS